MKSASTAVCTPQRSTAAVGRVHRRDNSEVQLYLAKLRRLLPARPGARRLTKLEVIQSVIDYICDLQYCLEMPLEAMDASVKTTIPPAPECEDRVAPTVDSAKRDGDRSQLISTQVEPDDEYLEEEEEEMEEDYEEYEETSPAATTPASSPAPAPLHRTSSC